MLVHAKMGFDVNKRLCEYVRFSPVSIKTKENELSKETCFGRHPFGGDRTVSECANSFAVTHHFDRLPQNLS